MDVFNTYEDWRHGISNVASDNLYYIKDIDIEGCEFLAPPNSVVVGVKTARAAIEEEVEEEGEDTGADEGEENKATDAPADAPADAPPAE